MVLVLGRVVVCSTGTVVALYNFTGDGAAPHSPSGIQGLSEMQ